ncbi:cytochrome P450 [Xylona heveae TC161]|uniref:Cytochrome P450 n=1 Tax=Xylona heveae (strain CBS 132557 / TC161) TaxID=1328760 RepID=A0A165GAJ4_XYLHT|nr:cytochrome P450 [Xylona heveae TC161]KZF21950.1 cytochrome P450 [Xylona heveae TC161]
MGVLTLGVVVPITLVSLILSNAVFNLYFHPLKNFPGPWFAGASRLWYSLKVFQGRHKYAIKTLHDDYGLVVRIAPNELSYIDPGAWNDIYGKNAHHNGSHTLEKETGTFGAGFGNSETLVDADSTTYKAQKKNALRGFSHQELIKKGGIMTFYADDFIQNLKNSFEKGNLGAVNIDAWIGNTILDIHGKLVIGQDFGAIHRGPLLHFIVKSMHKAVTVIQYVALLQYLPRVFTSLLSLPIFPRRDIFAVFSNLPPLGPAINERIATEKGLDKSSDMVHHMMAEGTIDHDTIRKNSFILILSGVETLPGYICSILYYLLENPQYFAKASNEIRISFQSQDEITPASTQDLPYLKSCLNEALRLSPPFVGALPRRVPPAGVTICGQFVPGGTIVGIHNWSLTHSTRYWKNPEQFRPERWLGDSAYADDKREYFRPFGFGPRTCVARHLVIIEAGLILAKILFEFDMELDASCGPRWPINRGHLVPTRQPLVVTVKSRTGNK